MGKSKNDPTRLERTKTDKSLKSERAETDVVLDKATASIEEKVDTAIQKSRSDAVTRGWSKIPEIPKRKALKRLIKEILIGPKGMDIYYYYNSLAEEKSLGVLSVEKESAAKVLAFGLRGTGSAALGTDSKQWVENCPLEELVIQGL